MPGKVIIACGLMGSGKSTLSRELAGALGPETLWLEEPDEKGGKNPYLSDYYGNPIRWSFTMQMHLLGTRYRSHLQAQWHAMATDNHAVLDSSYWQDTAYARLQMKQGMMTEREFATYQSIYHAMTASVMLPTVCLRTLVQPEVAQKRIQKRMEKQLGRKCEDVVDLAYLKGLDSEIDHMVGVLRQQGVTILDVPWDVDRENAAQRKASVEGLAARIQSLKPPDLFLDLHRRTI